MRAWPSIPISGRSICRTNRAVISASARDRRDDRDLLAALELGLQAFEEANVLLADVDVDEAAHALLVEEAVLDARVVLLEIVDQGGDGGAGRLDLVVAAGEGAEGRGDTDGAGGFHGCSPDRSSAARGGGEVTAGEDGVDAPLGAAEGTVRAGGDWHAPERVAQP